MIVKSLYLLFLLTFLVLPFFYHRKKSKPSMTKFFVQATVGTGPLVRGMPVAVLPSDFRTGIPLFAAGADTSRSGGILCCLPVYPSLPVAWRYHWRTDFRGGVLPLIVGLPHGKEALFKTIVFRES